MADKSAPEGPLGPDGKTIEDNKTMNPDKPKGQDEQSHTSFSEAFNNPLTPKEINVIAGLSQQDGSQLTAGFTGATGEGVKKKKEKKKKENETDKLRQAAFSQQAVSPIIATIAKKLKTVIAEKLFNTQASAHLIRQRIEDLSEAEMKILRPMMKAATNAGELQNAYGYADACKTAIMAEQDIKKPAFTPT